MSNYKVWTIEELGARVTEWRTRLSHAKSREQLLSIWGEVEALEREFDRAVFEERVVGRGEDDTP